MVDIPVNIKDYIIQSRQSKIPDSKIIESLKTANWPEDIINIAVQEANSVIPAVPESVEQVEQQQEQTNDKYIEKKQEKEQKPEPEKIAEEQKKEKKGFCFLTLLALLFSPIPFIGLGIAMTSLESIKKNKSSGTIIAVLALLINIAVIFFVVYLLIQMFTLPTSQLEGVSKWLVERFGILE